MASKKDKLKLWAETASTLRGRESFIKTNPELVDAIKAVLTLMAEGKSSASLPGLHRKLVELYDYPQTLSSLKNYVERHEKELWAKIKKR